MAAAAPGSVSRKRILLDGALKLLRCQKSISSVLVDPATGDLQTPKRDHRHLFNNPLSASHILVIDEGLSGAGARGRAADDDWGGALFYVHAPILKARSTFLAKMIEESAHKDEDSSYIEVLDIRVPFVDCFPEELMYFYNPSKFLTEPQDLPRHIANARALAMEDLYETCVSKLGNKPFNSRAWHTFPLAFVNGVDFRVIGDLLATVEERIPHNAVNILQMLAGMSAMGRPPHAIPFAALVNERAEMIAAGLNRKKLDDWSLNKGGRVLLRSLSGRNLSLLMRALSLDFQASGEILHRLSMSDADAPTPSEDEGDKVNGNKRKRLQPPSLLDDVQTGDKGEQVDEMEDGEVDERNCIREE
ncbi:hypothetical protein HK101_008992 [Irineochytrium annulatum]|nr:hypothetical protein HK101_008992 [Irineochytrium annulatum]